MFLKNFLKSLIKQKWNIGFTDAPLCEVVQGNKAIYHWLKHDFKKRWFADPFLLDVTDNTFEVLVEDYDEKRGYANLSKLVIDRKTMTIISLQTILENGSHLSFPLIIRKNNSIFVVPENSERGVLSLYSFNKDKAKLENEIEILDKPLTDAAFLEKNGQTYMFTTMLPNPNGQLLYIYRKKEGSWELFQTEHFNTKRARMAGDFFSIEGELYRPAQDSEKYYGGALIIQKMRFINGKWHFDDVIRLTSPHSEFQTGFHTLNSYKGITVVDVHGYCSHPVLSGIITSIINKFRKLR